MTLTSSTLAATTSLAEAPLTTGDKHVHVTPADPLFGWYIAVIIGLVLLGGVFSGLTLGLMGLDSVSASMTARSTGKQVLTSGQPAGVVARGHAVGAETGAKGVEAHPGGEAYDAGHVTALCVTGSVQRSAADWKGNTLVNTSLPVFLDQIVRLLQQGGSR